MATETPAKPKLKINVGTARSFTEPSATTPSATPAATPGESGRKIKLKLGTSSKPSTPAETPAVPVSATTKAGRQTKPTSRLLESKKREQEDLEVVDDAHGTSRPSKKVKIVPTRPSIHRTASIINIRAKGKPPLHPPGDGYDSEASDREEDPAIEEQIVLRMLPGEHCDYVRTCIKEHKIGIPRHQGGADIYMRFMEEDTRRAVVVVKGQPYAAVLVDLPTITETMKTWDKKTLMKSADICQMLLVFQKVKSEEEARKVPLPQAVESGFKWPHGLTPPMHDCVHRRFAKTISRKEIEDKEAEVERLLGMDQAASTTKWEWVDDRRQKSPEESMDEDQDAEGEMDDSGYFQPQGHGGGGGGGGDELADGDDLEAQLEAELEAGFAADMATPATQAEGVTPMTGVSTPAVHVNKQPAPEDDLFGDDGDGEDDDDDDDDDDDVDEDEQARLDEIRGVKEDIADLRKELKSLEERLQKERSVPLRKRIDERVRGLKRELQLKLTSIGEGDEEEEEQ